MSLAAISVRNEEIESVLRVMREGKYKDPQQMARQIVQSVYRALMERDWFLYTTRFASGGPTIIWGPIPTENAVLKLHDKLGLDANMICRATRMHSVAEISRKVEKFPTSNDERGIIERAVEQVLAERAS